MGDERVRPEHISIHAPVWGATKAIGTMSPTLNDFNSRSRVGSDQSIVNTSF